MIPCAVICLFLTVFFVKRVSLKRDDDAIKKAEAKAWVDSKKEKRRHGKEASHNGSKRRESDTSEPSMIRSSREDGGEGEPGKVGRVEKALEEAGRGVGEAGGLEPSRKEGIEEGVVNDRKE